ncbi:MAG: cupin [Actinobacteria bacterium 69-20]|jgi:quercetin dioxygenase-like cupin family protein|nr:MAG: cupin [Actinobacteria bacterium 69-20]
MTGSHSEIQAAGDHFRVTKWTIDPGGSIPIHRHDHPYIVVPLVTAAMDVTDATGQRATTQLRTGESYSRPVGTQHEIGNPNTNQTITFIEIELLG